MDISQRMKDLEFFYKEGQIDEKTYKEELSKVKKEAKIKSFKINFKIKVIIVLAIVLIVMIYIGYRTLGKKIIYVNSLDNLPNPVQAESTGVKFLEKNGSVANLNILARYSISGRVINIQKYMKVNTYNEFIPLDIGMAWGKLGNKDSKGKIEFWSIQDRFLRHKVLDDNWYRSIGGEKTIKYESSNSHLIASTDDIARQMNRIREDDYIRIEGFLVDVDLLDAKGNRYTASSSTTRGDTGDGACEIIYVTKIVWLKEK